MISVSMTAGQTALTRMCLAATSTAAVLGRPTTACLLAAKVDRHRTPAGLKHCRDLVLHAEGDAAHVNRKDLVENACRHLGKRVGDLAKPGVVEGNVKPVEAFDGAPDKPLDFFFAAYVGGDNETFAARHLDKGHRFFTFRLTPIGRDDAGPCGGERESRSRPNAGSSPGDEDYLACRSIHKALGIQVESRTPKDGFLTSDRRFARLLVPTAGISVRTDARSSKRDRRWRACVPSEALLDSGRLERRPSSG